MVITGHMPCWSHVSVQGLWNFPPQSTVRNLFFIPNTWETNRDSRFSFQWDPRQSFPSCPTLVFTNTCWAPLNGFHDPFMHLSTPHFETFAHTASVSLWGKCCSSVAMGMEKVGFGGLAWWLPISTVGFWVHLCLKQQLGPGELPWIDYSPANPAICHLWPPTTLLLGCLLSTSLGKLAERLRSWIKRLAHGSRLPGGRGVRCGGVEFA